MISTSPLEKALPGRENAKDWLTLKIVECLSQPMEETIAKKLSVFNAAYNAICQWGEDTPQNEKSKEKKLADTSDFSMDMAKSWMSKNRKQ